MVSVIGFSDLNAFAFVIGWCANENKCEDIYLYVCLCEGRGIGINTAPHSRRGPKSKEKPKPFELALLAVEWMAGTGRCDLTQFSEKKPK